MTCREDFTLPESLMEIIASEGMDGLSELIRIVLNMAMHAERQKYLKAELTNEQQRGKRTPMAISEDDTPTRVGKITFDIPQVREGGFYPQALEKGLRL